MLLQIKISKRPNNKMFIKTYFVTIHAADNTDTLKAATTMKLSTCLFKGVFKCCTAYSC